MIKKSSLVNTLQSDDFKRELYSAAQLSYRHNRVAGFCCFTDEQLKTNSVNKAVLGEKDHIWTDMTVFEEHLPGQGYHIPTLCYRTISTHFHSPYSDLHPSYWDIGDTNRSRLCNKNLRDSSSEFIRNVHDKNFRLVASYLDYVNPICIIGLAQDLIEIELLVFQEKTTEPFDMLQFWDLIADFCSRRYHTSYNPVALKGTIDIPTRFWTPKPVINFLNELGIHKAEYIKIIDGKIHKKNLEKLEKFEIIQTVKLGIGSYDEDYSDLSSFLED